MFGLRAHPLLVSILFWLLPLAAWSQAPPSLGGDRLATRLLDHLVAAGSLSDRDASEVRAEAQAARLDAELETAVSHTSRGFRVRDRASRGWLRWSGRVQVRLGWSPDSRPQAMGFSVSRTQLRLQGSSADEAWRYRVQMSFQEAVAGPPGEGDHLVAELKEAWVEWRPTDRFAARWGQLKTPGPRQRMTGQARLQLIDRSEATRTLGRPRNPGMELVVQGQRWSGRVAILNGEGENRANDGTGLLYASRVAWHPGGAVPFREGVRLGERGWRWEIGAFGWFDVRDAGRDRWGAGSDLILRNDVWSVHLEGGIRRDSSPGGDQRRVAWLLQLGRAIGGRSIEIVGRWSVVRRGAVTEHGEVLVGLSHLIEGRAHKWQVEVGKIQRFGEPDLLVVRLQLQLTF